MLVEKQKREDRRFFRTVRRFFKTRNTQVVERLRKVSYKWLIRVNAELETTGESIPNVYVAGSPLVMDSKIFKGRRDVFLALERELSTPAEQRPALLLFGARRTGKTSIIKQIPARLGSDVVPVEIDLLRASTTENIYGLLDIISRQIAASAYAHRNFSIQPLDRTELEKDPYIEFGNWLHAVEDKIGSNKWILLALDEYEYLGEMIEKGRLDERIFQLLRDVTQRYTKISLLLSGAHIIEDLPSLWARHLVNIRVLKIGSLDESDALELIVKPIPNFPLQYSEEAIRMIINVTGKQPYLIQAICKDLVNHLNENKKLYAEASDVEQALAKTLDTASTYFSDILNNQYDSDDDQRLIMRHIARNKSASASEIEDISKSPETVSRTLGKLINRGILIGKENRYFYQVELVRRWMEKH